MINTSNKPVYKISRNSQTEADGSTKEYVRIYNGGFTSYSDTHHELENTLDTWENDGYTVSLYYITYLSAKGEEKESFSFEVDFIKNTEAVKEEKEEINV